MCLISRELNTQCLFLLVFLPFGARGRYHKTHMHYDLFDYLYMMQNQLKEWIKAEIVRRGRDLESVTPPPPPPRKNINGRHAERHEVQPFSY